MNRPPDKTSSESIREELAAQGQKGAVDRASETKDNRPHQDGDSLARPNPEAVEGASMRKPTPALDPETDPLARILRALTVPQAVAIIGAFATVATAGFWFGGFLSKAQLQQLSSVRAQLSTANATITTLQTQLRSAQVDSSQLAHLERQLQDVRQLSDSDFRQLLSSEQRNTLTKLHLLLLDALSDSDVRTALVTGPYSRIWEAADARRDQFLTNSAPLSSILTRFAARGYPNLGAWLNSHYQEHGSPASVSLHALQQLLVSNDLRMEAIGDDLDVDRAVPKFMALVQTVVEDSLKSHDNKVIGSRPSG